MPYNRLRLKMSNVKNQNVGTSFEIIYIFNSVPFIAHRLAQQNERERNKKETCFVIARAYRIYIELLLLICMTGEISLSHSHTTTFIHNNYNNPSWDIHTYSNCTCNRMEIENSRNYAFWMTIECLPWLIYSEIHVKHANRKKRSQSVNTHKFTQIHWSIPQCRKRSVKFVECIEMCIST